MIDRRLHPANHKFAAIELEGQVEAQNFVEGEMCRITAPVADLRCDLMTTQLDRQLVFGDRFRVLERFGQVAFGQADRGGYVGHVLQSALGAWSEPTHQVSVRASFGFHAPDFKSRTPVPLTLGARVTVRSLEGKFARTIDGMYVPQAHLGPLHGADDPASEAEKLLGAPYLWGGNSQSGIDCSGLVQAAFVACGAECPGDSDLQEAALGETIAQGDLPHRGDLYFWKGHVAMAVNDHMLIHANAHHMAVALEPIEDAITRIAEQGDGQVTSRKRLVGQDPPYPFTPPIAP